MKKLKKFEENWSDEYKVNPKTGKSPYQEKQDNLLDSGQHNKVRDILDNFDYIINNLDEFDYSDIDIINLKIEEFEHKLNNLG